VTRALNVCGDAGTKAFGGCTAGCIQLPAFDKGDVFSYSDALGRALNQGIQVTLYYGMQDTACNYVGGFQMATALEWSGSEHFAAAPMEDLMIGGMETGSVKTYGGLTWVQIEGAGHMVPINNPAAASFAINTLIRGRDRHSRGLQVHDPPILGIDAISRWARGSGASSSAAAAGGGGSAQSLYRLQYMELFLAAACAGLLVSGWAAFRFCRRKSSLPYCAVAGLASGRSQTFSRASLRASLPHLDAEAALPSDDSFD